MRLNELHVELSHVLTDIVKNGKLCPEFGDDHVQWLCDVVIFWRAANLLRRKHKTYPGLSHRPDLYHTLRLYRSVKTKSNILFYVEHLPEIQWILKVSDWRMRTFCMQMV